MKESKDKIIQELLSELNAVKSYYGDTSESDIEKQAREIVERHEADVDYNTLQTKFYYTPDEYKKLVKENNLPTFHTTQAVTIPGGKNYTFAFEQGYFDLEDDVYVGINDWFGDEMKPVGIVVNDYTSVYPQHLQNLIRKFNDTQNIDERIILVTGMLSELKKFSPKMNKQIKYNNGSWDYLCSFGIDIYGNSKGWPGRLKESGTIRIQHDGLFHVTRTCGSSVENIYDISSIMEAMEKAGQTITRNGIEEVSLFTDGADEQLGNSPVNVKAQTDFLSRMGYVKIDY